jgi:RNA polymerase sigma factor (sigma-70 family)
VEVSALKHAGVAGVHGRSPLLRLQSDERLVGLIRRGNHHAFEALMGRYQARLLAFCRHMLASKEDAEDVLQEVFAAAFNAIQADERPLNVRPWLYRIARNRSLNHLRRTQAIGMDSMDVHLSENGQTTADRVHRREEFRMLLADVQQLPETQRSALLLREIDALSYDQIAEAMDTTVPSVKSLLVRARVSLAEAAEARLLSCEEVRLELGEVAEGLKKLAPPVRRHLKGCERCATFRKQLRSNNRALAAVLPLGPVLILKKLLIAHLGLGGTATAGGGAGAGAGAGAAASTAAGTAAAGSAAGSVLSAGASAVATKAAAGIAAAAIVSVGAVEVRRVAVDHPASPRVAAAAPSFAPANGGTAAPASATKPVAHHKVRPATPKALAAKTATTPTTTTTTPTTTAAAPPPSRTETVSDTTILPPSGTSTPPSTTTTTTTAPAGGGTGGTPPPPPSSEPAPSSPPPTSSGPAPPPPPPSPTPQPH